MLFMVLTITQATRRDEVSAEEYPDDSHIRRRRLGVEWLKALTATEKIKNFSLLGGSAGEVASRPQSFTEPPEAT